MSRNNRLIQCLAAAGFFGATVIGAGCKHVEPEGHPSHSHEPMMETKPVEKKSGWYRPAGGPGWAVNQLAFPTGDPATSAILLSTVSPVEVRQGAPYTSELHVTNLTNAELQNVVLTSTDGTNITVTSATPEAAKAGNGWSWALGNLKAGETRIVKLNGSAPAVGNAAMCFAVSYNNLLCTTVRVTQPALAVTKTAPAEALICDPITFTFDVRNTGTGTAPNVVLTDTLPAGLKTTDGQSVATANLGDLKAGEAKRVTVTVKADKTGSYSNMGAVAGGELKASSNTTTTVVKAPKLEIACQSPECTFLGRDVTYSFTVKNSGDAAATNTKVSIPMVSGASFVSATEGGMNAASGTSWNVGTLAPGASKSVTVTVRPAAMDTVRLSATAEAYCAPAVTANCMTNVQGIPAILLECVDLVDPVEVGGQTTYVVTATNQGSANGTGVKIIVDLDPSQEYVSSQGVTVASVNGRRIEFAPLPSLAPKTKAEWRIVVKATAPADARLKLGMTSDQFTKPIEETESTNQYR